MGEHRVNPADDEARLRAFMRSLLADVNALERMLQTDIFESGVRRIGAEQEMFLVDSAGLPVNRAVEVMRRLDHPSFTHELALFNLEANLAPQEYGGACLRRMEEELRELLDRAHAAAEEEGCDIAMCGILPTLRRADLGLESMTPNPRYIALNDAMMRLRGGEFHFRIKGQDELEMTHDNVMLESCNTSFQVHFQVGADEFARCYNLAQAVTGPVLAVAVNSPLLLGHRLWSETRVALFQQSVDSRSMAHQERGLRPRVSFGDAWVESSVLEIFREDIARFRVVLASDPEPDPMELLDRGEVPKLQALCLHNGTVYRWNRACYGIHGGRPHLRIENRVLPAGPTVLDEVSNAAFYFGLLSGLTEEVGDVRKVMAFDHAKENFTAAARFGLRAQFTWFDGEVIGAPELIRDRLIGTARRGLEHAGVDAADIDRYLGCIEARVNKRMTGSRWACESLARMRAPDGDARVTKDHAARALALATIANQKSGKPVHEWPLAQPAQDWRQGYLEVGQFMTTDLFTVNPEDVVDLAASLMDWRHIRHVPVESSDGKLVGLVSHRALLRLVGQGIGRDRRTSGIAVKDIMKVDPVSVSPDTPTLKAIEAMRHHRVGCLPVVEKGKLVGIITERDLLNMASALFERHLRGQAADTTASE